MTHNETKELTEDFVQVCADENTEAVLVISIFKDGTSRLCVAGENKLLLSESAVWAAHMISGDIELSPTPVSESNEDEAPPFTIPPSPLLH